MKIRLSDYVANFLVERGVTDCFSIVGGGAMHLNDAFGHCKGLKVTYQHHEQACAIAAEAYARLHNKIALVCVTTGPGGTNALTGVVGGWLDSIPMFIVSGQVRYDTTARYEMKFTDGYPLRSAGDQEYDIVRSVLPMTKYAVMIEDPLTIRYALEKAWHLATTGRKGPVWIDIPVNFQGMTIETDELVGYEGSKDEQADDESLPPPISRERVQEVLGLIDRAKRPVIYAGGGVRLSGGYELFEKAVETLKIPVVTYWNSIDLMRSDSPYYVGRGGNMGDRAGNFAVQNADLVLAIGTRISIRQTGYDYKSWARAAKVVMVDIDRAEMKKPTLHVDMEVWADAKDFLQTLLEETKGRKLPDFTAWREKCISWREQYPVVTQKQRTQRGKANVYAFLDALSDALPEGSLTAVSNGACCVAGHQTYKIKAGTRFIINNAIASMGYGLPAAIGLCIAGGRQKTVCLEGDGSIMMNLQELQTVVTNRLSVKIFLINNCGYHSIRITQNNLFKEHSKVGIGEESGDLSFPDFEKIACAFGFPYEKICSNDDFSKIEAVLARDGFSFCEVFTDTEQVWEPKSSTKKLPDGSLFSPPLEDLAPFLPREELKKIMEIPLIDEQK